MTAQTIVEYNGVRFFQCLTKSFVEEAVFDDTDTDLLYHKFTILIQGYVHAPASNFPGDSPHVTPVSSAAQTGKDAAMAHSEVRRRLVGPRGRFEMTCGANTIGNVGSRLLFAEPFPGRIGGGEAAAGSANSDLNNGPKCRRFKITHITGAFMFRVEAEFEICIAQCRNLRNKKGVLSNRWTVTDDIDRNLRLTRTYTGHLRIANSNINPHEFRDWCLPPLSPLMRRDKMNFVSSANGLSLDYTITDKETPYSAPPPATSWDFTHSEETGDGKQSFADASCKLIGESFASKKEMMVVALAAVRAKLFTPAAGDDKKIPNSRVIFLKITDSITDDTTSVSVEGRVLRPIDPIGFKEILDQDFGNALELIPSFKAIVKKYSSQLSRMGRDGEKIQTSGAIQAAGILAAYLQNPCDDAHTLQVPKARSGNDRAKSEADLEIQLKIDRSNNGRGGQPFHQTVRKYLDDDHKVAVYTHYRMESTYTTEEHKVLMPVADGFGEGFSSLSASNQKRDSARVIHLARPTTKRHVLITATRVGAHPRLPTPVDYTDSNRIKAVCLLRKSSHGSPERLPDGSQIFTASAEIVYGLSRAPLPKEKLRIGVNPWEVIGMHSTNGTTIGDGAEDSGGNAPPAG